ncbi:MAG: transcription termination factor NusA [Candidatus Paceibacterota bacterium]
MPELDLKNFKSAVSQIADEKGISSEKVMETIEHALAAAYKKDHGKKGQNIEADFDPETGEAEFQQVKEVVEEDNILTEDEKDKIKELKEENKEVPQELQDKVWFNERRHIKLEEAKEEDEDVEVGDELKIPLETPEDYGRIAAQTAKQVIMQKIKEAERDAAYEKYQEKEGTVVSGIVQRKEKGTIYLDIGEVLGVLPKKEQIDGEHYESGQRYKVYVTKVESTSKGPLVFVSRAYPKLVSKLFEIEVPEIDSGKVEIKSIAREAGSRTKVAVTSTEEKIDPIGSTIGQRGTRVMAVINELDGEKIDVVEWKDDPADFIANALSPAKVLEVKLKPKNKAIALVEEDQLSLAIGKEGQNVRLAAKLTGWKIDVKTPEEQEEEQENEESEEESETEEENNQEESKED